MTTPNAKNEQFVKQIGVAADVFHRPRIVVELPPSQERRPDAAAAFMLAGNLLARMFADVSLVAPNVTLGPNPWKLQRLEELLEPLSALAAGTVRWGTTGSPDVVLSIGAPPTIVAKRSSFVTFDGWSAALDMELAEGRPGPFGALFAACYGAAQVFLHAAQLAGSTRRPIAPFRLSLLTYDGSDAYVPLPPVCDLDTSHLVGVGAVGSALVYALAHLSRCRGVINLIDNDPVDRSNLHRYVLMRLADVGFMKPAVAATALADTGIEAVPHGVSYEEYRKQYTAPVELLITPVDSEAGRRQLATTLPQSVLNAATGLSTVTVSRHGFADGKACLHCLYMPQVEEMTTERRLSIDLGLPLYQIEEHLRSNKTIGGDLVELVERNLGKPPGTFADWKGKHLQSLYQHAVCGEAHVTTAAGTVVAPLSFISAAAGVALAAELMKGCNPQLAAFALDNYFRFDTLAAPNPEFRRVRLPDPTGRCICHDRDFVDVYRERYPVPERAAVGGS